jgi:chromosome partitioning protein
MRLVVGVLKGGTAKTTTAVYLAAGLADSGRTLLVDADPQAKTLMDWRGVAGADGWSERITVVSHVEPRSLARDIGGMARDYEHVVVDVGGESDLLLAAALVVADHLVCPVTASPPELRRLPATFDLAERAAIGAGREITARVLLVKVERRSIAVREARELLVAENMPAMTADVRYLPAAIPNSFGTLPVDLVDYGPVLAELTADVAVSV